MRERKAVPARQQPSRSPRRYVRCDCRGWAQCHAALHRPPRFDPDGLGAFHSRYRVVGIDAAGNDIDDAWGYYRHGTNTNPATPGAASKSQPFSQYIKSVGHNGLKVYIDRYADGGPMYLAIIAEVLT